MSKSFAEFIQTKQKVESWQEAIRVAAKPMLDKGYINEQYIASMIQNVVDNGPYIVVMPDVAIPHTRVEDGSFQTSTSLLKLKEGVLFPQDKEVHLIIVLSAHDNDAHMALLSDMVDVFMDEEKMNILLSSNDCEHIRAITS